MKEILFLSTEFKYRLWGGQALKSIYDTKLPYDKTGEAWCISAHPNGPSKVLNGKYKGKTLIELYDEARHLFGNINQPEFPLLVKIIDANDDLSIQVHPDDKLAAKYHSLGKTECWYILDADPNAYIIMGHKALSKTEFLDRISKGQWDELLNKIPVKKGDFFYIPAGVIHALGKGLLILETQQSSDITYRLYDYDRIDKNGLKRELHLEAGVDATLIPSPNVNETPSIEIMDSNKITTLIKSSFFTVQKLDLQTPYDLTVGSFKLVTCLEGAGLIDNQPYKKGDSCLVPHGYDTVKITPTENTLMIVSNL